MYQKHPIVVFWSVKCFVVGCCISRHNDFLRKQGSPSSSLPSIHEYYSSNPIKSSCTTYTDIRCYSHPNVLCGVRASHSLPTRIARLVGNIGTQSSILVNVISIYKENLDSRLSTPCYWITIEHHYTYIAISQPPRCPSTPTTEATTTAHTRNEKRINPVCKVI